MKILNHLNLLNKSDHVELIETQIEYDQFELILPDNYILSGTDLINLNLNGYVFIESQTNIEFDGHPTQLDGYYNIYYFIKIF